MPGYTQRPVASHQGALVAFWSQVRRAPVVALSGTLLGYARARRPAHGTLDRQAKSSNLAVKRQTTWGMSAKPVLQAPFWDLHYRDKLMIYFPNTLPDAKLGTKRHLFDLVTDSTYRNGKRSSSYDFIPLGEGPGGQVAAGGRKWGYDAQLPSGTADKRPGEDPDRKSVV